MSGPKFNPDNKPGYTYELLADHFTKLIQNGEWKPNSRLPGERALAEEYGVALGTVRHATDLLRERGLVLTLKSKGTFVTARE